MPKTEDEINFAVAEVLQSMRRDWRVVSNPTGVIQRIGGRAVPVSGRSKRKKSSMLKPDIYIEGEGVRPVIIEHEFGKGPNVNEEASGRLECETLDGRRIEAVIALKTPMLFKHTNVTGQGLRDLLQRATDIKYAVYSPERFPTPPNDWLTGSFSDIAQAAADISIPKKEIEDCVYMMSTNIDHIANIINNLDKKTKEKIGELLWQKENMQTWKIAGLILSNAFVFHSHIGGLDNVKTLREILVLDTIPVTALTTEWNKILKINYYAIFEVAKKILSMIDDKVATEIIKNLLKMTDGINSRGLATSTDMYGSLIQEMLTDRATLAAFYTRPESAELLAGLTVPPAESPIYNSASKMKEVRVGDFACGTGTLLTSVYRRIGFLFEIADKKNDMSKIHSHLMSKSLYGLDVLPSAVHLTVSALAGMHPKTLFHDTHIIKMPFGKEKGIYHIGSLDLINEQTTLDLAGTMVTSKAESPIQHQNIPKFDIIVMNPPFTTNTKSNANHIAMFSFFDTKRIIQNAMNKKQKEIFKGTCGNGAAGEATYFLAIADQKLKPGGRIGLVMPSTFAWGSSWKKCRELMSKKYESVFVISISATERPKMSFSFGAKMGEILIIGKKRNTEQSVSDDNLRGTFVSLQRRPESVLEARQVCREIIESKQICSLNDNIYRYTPLKIGNNVIGSIMNCPLDSKWWWFVNIRDPYLAQFAYKLTHGVFHLPGSNKQTKIPIKAAGRDKITTKPIPGIFGITHRLVASVDQKVSPPPPLY